MMSPFKRLLSALIFALPAAGLVVSPAMAASSKPKSQQTAQTQQTKKSKKSGQKSHAKAKKKPAAATVG